MNSNGDHHTPSSSDGLDDIREITSIVDGLINMMSAGNIGSLRLEYGSLRVSLKSKDGVASPAIVSTPSSAAGVQPVEPRDDGPQSDPSDHIISAPMIGTFYVAPAPNEPPYVQPGDEVVEGQTIGIIEAMKIMNEIAADRAGTVIEILAADGQTVEYGSPLLRIKPVDA